MSQTPYGQIDQAELAILIRKKDKIAFEYLYDHYSSAIYGIILRIVSDEKIAEEVTQDAFLKVWDKIEAYNATKGRLFTWMLNLSRNLAIDKLRSKEIKRVNKTDELERNVYDIENDNLIHQNIDRIGVRKFLDKLREEEKIIVELIYFHGYTQSEVSDERNIPLGTVKTRLRMALVNLRKEFGEG